MLARVRDSMRLGFISVFHKGAAAGARSQAPTQRQETRNDPSRETCRHMLRTSAASAKVAAAAAAAG